jgi:hypothetical protein
MATIRFFNDHGWDNLPPVTSSLTPETVIQGLITMRQEWEVATGAKGAELIKHKGSMGLALSDFCDMLNLTPEQREQALGHDLAEVTK